MSFLIPAAYAQEAAAGPAGTGFEWVFLVGFLVIFYLMIWRPQAKRAKEHKNLIAGLQKGDEVVTSGGIAGKVTKVADDFVVIEVSDNVELKFQKVAIAATLPKGPAAASWTSRRRCWWCPRRPARGSEASTSPSTPPTCISSRRTRAT